MTAPMRRFALQGCACAVAIISVLSFAPAAQEPPQPQPEQPRFRAGANLVRIDAYVSQNGEAVPDLQAEDFEVLEDGVRQKIESFEIIRARPPVSQAARAEPNTVAESRAMAANSEARLFVLFMDVWHVHLEGWYRAQGPITNLLDRLIGQDDLIGVMTPEMSARNLTLARRTTTIDGIFRQNWFWGQRQRLVTDDPREQELQLCYPDTGETANIAQELIDRRRERKTLDAIEDLIIHLEGIREERKFVILLSEGWRLPRRDDRLGRTIGNNVPRTPPVGIGVDGRLTTGPPAGTQDFNACERERLRLAAEDLEQDFRTLLQRANRANVSFYTVDPRGLAVFDEDLSLRRATNISADRAMLQSRQTALARTGREHRWRRGGEHVGPRRRAPPRARGHRSVLPDGVLLHQHQTGWSLPHAHGARQTSGRRCPRSTGLSGAHRRRSGCGTVGECQRDGCRCHGSRAASSTRQLDGTPRQRAATPARRFGSDVHVDYVGA